MRTIVQVQKDGYARTRLRKTEVDGRGGYLAARTHCKHGHPYDAANTYEYTAKDGWTRRQCRTCMNAHRSRRIGPSSAYRVVRNYGERS